MTEDRLISNEHTWTRPSELRHAHLDCFSGAAGDMILAACLDAAGSESENLLTYLNESLRKGLPELDGEFELKKERVWRGSGQIAATHVAVMSRYEHEPAPVPQKSNDPKQKSNKTEDLERTNNTLEQSSLNPCSYEDDHSRCQESHEHDHSHVREHDHSHSHEHEHSHSHQHEHSHGHQHEHSHKHELDNRENEPDCSHGHSHDHEHCRAKGALLRNLPEIRRMLEESSELWIPRWVRTKAVETFTMLAEAEATVHGAESIDSVHFHEVGAVDSIVDTVGSLLALHALGAVTFSCSRLPMGEGAVWTQHGLLPTPPPAALRLMIGMPTTPGPPGWTGELITPTGAALLRALMTTDGQLSPAVRPPPFTLRQIGIGAGTKDFDHPNVLRILIGDSVVKK